MKQAMVKASKVQKSLPRLVSIFMMMTVLASLICLGYPCDPAWATEFTEAPEFKITSSDGEVDDEFGSSVAIDGDTAVVGVRRDHVGANINQGSAYVFTRSGTIWTEQAHLTASDGAEYDEFGWSVAISGDTVVVGAYYDTVGANAGQGSAYVFTRNGTIWTEQAHLTASDGAAGDFLGWSVAISGDTLVAGAHQDEVGTNTCQGSVYVFTRSGTIWTEQAHLTANDGEAWDYFGCAVGISGNTVLVGAYYDNIGANTRQGSAYVFTRSGTTWTEQAHLTASDGAADDRFGYSVAISDDTTIVGTYQDDVGANTFQGSAYVFTRSGTTWTEQAHLTANDGEAWDYFGCSVAISGDTAVVGAIFDNVGENISQGSAYIFTRSGTIWTQQAHLTASDGAASDYFGYSVGISDDIAVIGAVLDDIGTNTDQGSAYVYDGGEYTAQISATVTLTGILVSVTIPEGYPTAVDYGVMLPNAEAEPIAYSPDTHSYLRVENNGNVAENLLIRGDNATCGTGTWVLAETPGADQYSHLYGVGQTPGSYSPLGTSVSPLATNVTVAGTLDFNLKIQTPTSSTVYGKYSTSVTILAVAH